MVSTHRAPAHAHANAAPPMQTNGLTPLRSRASSRERCLSSSVLVERNSLKYSFVLELLLEADEDDGDPFCLSREACISESKRSLTVLVAAFVVVADAEAELAVVVVVVDTFNSSASLLLKMSISVRSVEGAAANNRRCTTLSSMTSSNDILVASLSSLAPAPPSAACNIMHDESR